MNNPLILFPTILLPHAPDLLLEDVQQIDQTLLLVLRSTAPTAACPLCQQPATRIHSHYARHPADLPWGGHAIRFELHVRKFFCLMSTCPRRIFTERLPAGAWLYGDKGYNSADDEALLEGETGVRLVPIRKANMTPNPLDERVGLRRYRKKIEAVNSQLEAWGVQRLHARTHAGFMLKVGASLFALLCVNAF